MKLTVIRHTAVDVPQGICYGFTDVALKSSFPAEAETVKNRLADKTFDRIYSSPLSRCTLLAGYCGYVPAVDVRLKELNFGDWEMKSWMEIDKQEATDWFADWLNYPAKNGESYRMMQQRVYAFMDELKSSGAQSVCIFTHGGVIRLIHVYLGLLSIEDSFEVPVEYGQIFEFTFQLVC
ncbi:MAG: alpha-ribazole phosphatase [Dysgonamonadaceae bacterium]|jgi:alpha-ribazole phosphatase|nr:alpha-ribazole phosphatase [Dysgonamonadaceae bacterium]